MGLTGLMMMWMVLAVSVLAFHELTDMFGLGNVHALGTSVAFFVAGEAAITWSNRALGWFDGSIVALPYAAPGEYVSVLVALTALMLVTAALRARGRGTAPARG